MNVHGTIGFSWEPRLNREGAHDKTKKTGGDDRSATAGALSLRLSLLISQAN